MNESDLGDGQRVIYKSHSNHGGLRDLFGTSARSIGVRA
jgi:hypothetical protein